MKVVKVNCLRCDRGWERKPGADREQCPGCGTPDWDVELDLAARVPKGSEYRVVEERELWGHVLRLDLASLTTPATASVELNHRLFKDYRHRKGDLNLPDGRGGVIAFGVAGDGEDRGKWVIASFRRLHPSEARKLETEKCRVHRWAIQAGTSSFDINAAAHLWLCTCPPPICELCKVAGSFAEDRHTGGSDSGRYWAELQQAVLRDRGWIA